ncbi:Uncharacterised protein [Cronobacter sakazakii]|nr:Uncharacterised protein [Cronobacter sakazakii]
MLVRCEFIIIKFIAKYIHEIIDRVLDITQLSA